MSGSPWKCFSAFVALGCVAFLVGCSEATTETANSQSAEPAAEVTPEATEGEAWWCVEHGVPEEECARCDVSLVASFKEKDDWCEEHNRPESQCFLCSPKRFDKFAARYEAKFGKQPPKPTE